jgi:hypothetical protein
MYENVSLLTRAHEGRVVAPVAPRRWKVENAYLCIFTHLKKVESVLRKKEAPHEKI